MCILNIVVVFFFQFSSISSEHNFEHSKPTTTNIVCSVCIHYHSGEPEPGKKEPSSIGNIPWKRELKRYEGRKKKYE